MTNNIDKQRDALRERGISLLKSNHLVEARALFSEFCELYPEDAEGWYALGTTNGKLGNIDEAGECCRRALEIQPDHSRARINLGNVLLSQGNQDAAVECYVAAIQYNPNLPSAYVNLGNLRMQNKDYEKAVNNYNQAIRLTPANASLLYSLGIALLNLGKSDEAIAHLYHAVQLKPDYIDAYSTLGNALLRQGRPDEVVALFTQALSYAPNSAQIHSNLGVVYHELQQYDNAAACFQRALDIDPRYVTALNNLGTACRLSGHFDPYFEYYVKLIDSLPDPMEARIGFAENLKYIAYFGYSPWLDSELIKCFSIDAINHNSLAGFAARSLKDKYEIHQPLEYDDNAIKAIMESMASDELFMIFLRRTTNVDSDMEILLTRIRRMLLIKIHQGGNTTSGEIRVATCLALQCFNNEYVFVVGDDETQLISAIKDAIEKSVPLLSSPTEELERNILAFGMYDNLYSLSVGRDINTMPKTAWSESICELLKLALANALEEEQIKQQIDSIAPVENHVSQLVQSQYEENPYPRWLSIPKVTSGNIRRIAKNQFHHLELPPVFDGPIRILVAGCGTGQHPILTALTYDNSEILAVDISRSSLAYAVRMARRNGIQNIQFKQADILDLSKLTTRFHMVECIGVLHHMEDPLQGWKILSNLLVENGIMSIGLYSEKGRKQIVAARKVISEENIPPDKSNIRSFRRRVLMHELGNQIYDELYKSYDFYSISRCRDLLFNIMEHRFTIPQLAASINDLDLEFIGFKFETRQIQNLYLDQFPHDQDMTNLSLWDQFEQEHPDTFGRMYQFWCQKKA